MPEASTEAAPEAEGGSLLERELMPHLRELRRARIDCAEVIREVIALSRSKPRDSSARWLAEVAATLD